MIHKKENMSMKTGQAKKMRVFFMHLDKLVGKFSLYVFLRYAKVKTLSAVIRDFQIWQFEILPILVCQVVYCCRLLIRMLKIGMLKDKLILLMKKKIPSLVSQKDLRAISRSPSIPALTAKHCWVRATKGTRAWRTSSSMTSPILKKIRSLSYYITKWFVNRLNKWHLR